MSGLNEAEKRKSIRRKAVTTLLSCVVSLLEAVSVSAQQNNTLPEGATVSALGRTALVRSDGSFSISNVPANIGRFRVRMIHPDGRTAESICLTPVLRGTTLVPPLIFGPLTPVSASLTVGSFTPGTATPMETFTAQGQMAQLRVIGNLQGGGMAELTNDLCTTYFSSNTALATVNASGLVTVNRMPLFPSTLTISALNEGVVGTFSFKLQPNTDVDGDGLPNDWEVRNGLNPNSAGDAAQDADADGLTNLQEFQQNLAPRDPDTDRDGISDGPHDPDGTGPIIAGPDPDPLRPETTPPTCALTAPANGATVIEGETIIVRATATDNVGVSRVNFASDVGGLNFTDSSAPYEARFTVPAGVSQVTLSIVARDIAGNRGTCPPVTLNVIPDPLTTVNGRVVNESRTPLSGANVSVLGRTGITGTDGSFSILNVPTVQGNLVVEATFTQQDGTVLTGASAFALPVRGGTTNVGDIIVLPRVDFVYTNNNVGAANTVSAFSVAANGMLTQIAGSPFATGGTGSGFVGGFFAANRITVCVVGNLLFASNSSSNNISVFSINPATGFLTAVPGSPFATGGTAGNGISLGVTPDNRFLFAASAGSSNITSYSIAANGVLTPIPGSPFPIGRQPDGIKVSPNGQFLAAALPSPVLSAVAMFSIAANGTLTPVPGSPFPTRGSGSAAGVEINCAGNFVFVGKATSGTTLVDVFSIGANGALTLIPDSPFSPGVGINSNVPLLSPDDRLLFVSNQLSDSVTVFTVALNGSLALVPGSPFPVGADQPSGMAANLAGTFLYTANFDQTISVFSVASNGVLTPVPGSPFATGQLPGLLSLTAFPAKNCVRR